MQAMIRAAFGTAISCRAGYYFRGIAQNAGTFRPESDTLDIRVAKDNGYIIADASGAVGFNPLNPGIRDSGARRAQDLDGKIGDLQ